MTDETERKILEAALKLFSELGYGGATTRVIASNAGFTEMTLYTKFKNKQNLFDQVMIYGLKKMDDDASSILNMDGEFEEPIDFLEAFVRKLVEYIGNNLEFFKIIYNQERKTVGPIMKDSVYSLSKQIEEHIPDQKLDYPAFTLTIFSFAYMFNLGVYYGPTDASREDILDKFIYNLSLIIQ